MALPVEGRLLDGGCGTGGTLQRISTEIPGLQLFGLEIDPKAAQLARDRFGAMVAVGSVERMPYGDATLEAIISLDVLCHAGVSPERSLAEFGRCLRPGGFLFLSLPAYQWMLSGHDIAVSNSRRFTRSGLRRVLAEGNLVIEADGYWNSLLFPLMASHRLLTRSVADSDVRPFPAWQERLFGAALGFEAKLRQAGLALPFGGSVWVRCRRKPSAG
jgi:SAM-dependent methyltransferase